MALNFSFVPNPLEKRTHGKTPLHIAVGNGNTDEIERLVEAGADLNARTYDAIGSKPIHIAAMRGAFESLRYLIEHGARFDATDADGYTALHWAIWSRRVEMVEYLLFIGLDPNARTAVGRTAVHFAMQRADRVLIESLCAFGADIETLDTNGQTALMTAVLQHRHDVALLLLSLNANVCKTDRFNWHVSLTTNETIAQAVSEHRKKSDADRQRTRVETLQRLQLQLGARLWKYAHRTIVDVCIAMSSLELPPYVSLWIIDWLPNYDRVSHHKKIQLIESVRASIWKIKPEN